MVTTLKVCSCLLVWLPSARIAEEISLQRPSPVMRELQFEALHGMFLDQVDNQGMRCNRKAYALPVSNAISS